MSLIEVFLSLCRAYNLPSGVVGIIDLGKGNDKGKGKGKSNDDQDVGKGAGKSAGYGKGVRLCLKLCLAGDRSERVKWDASHYSGM